MDKKEYSRYAALMIALITGLFNGKKIKREKLEGMDLQKLFAVAEKHNLAAVTAYALEKQGITDPHFEQAKDKAIRKSILFDAEAGAIFSELEKKGIWYMPLKGTVLKKYYPNIGMRQMADADILFDSTRAEDVRDIFLSRDFECTDFGFGVHDSYHKEPVYNFEMHRCLFSRSAHATCLCDYYEDFGRLLIPDDASKFARHLSDEDFYLYMRAHEYKHYSNGGTGLRSLLDIYVFLNAFSDRLDWDYIKKEAEGLGIADFEKAGRELSLKLFKGEKLDAGEKKMLAYYVFSGTYGTIKNHVEHSLEKLNGSRLRYVMKRLFPSYGAIVYNAPWVKKSVLLIPAGYLYRIVHHSVTRYRGVRNELRAVVKAR